MKKILLFTIIIILIPLIIIGLKKEDEILYKIKYGSINNKVINVKINNTGKITSVPLEEYVVGVVAGEMPASFDMEALKAQSVASRTYVLKKKESSNLGYDISDDTNNQVYITKDKMKNKWKDDYEENLKKITEVVFQTKGQVILYKNTLIDAMFFSTSNGYTENSEDVFSNSKPYLISVDSSWDIKESPVFNSSMLVSKKEFLFNLNLPISNKIEIKDIEKTNTGRIKSLVINNNKIDSKKIREVFNLKSTSFNIDVSDDQVKFIVKGFGHGVGMSQYGANGMAKEGYSYQEILKHYYQNCDVVKIN